MTRNAAEDTPVATRSAHLADRFAGSHGRRKREIEAAGAGAHRDRKPRVGSIVHMVWHPGGFAPEEQDVVRREVKVGVGCRRLRAEKHQPAALPGPPRRETFPGNVTGQGGHLQIVHPRTFERSVGHVEAGRLDDVDGEVQACGHAQDGAGIAGNVWLIERNVQVVWGRGRQYRVLLNSSRNATVTPTRLRSVSFQLASREKEVYSAVIVNSNRRGSQMDCMMLIDAIRPFRGLIA